MLPKSATFERIESNFQIEGITLSGEQIQEIDALGAEKFKVEWDSSAFP